MRASTLSASGSNAEGGPGDHGCRIGGCCIVDRLGAWTWLAGIVNGLRYDRAMMRTALVAALIIVTASLETGCWWHHRHRRATATAAEVRGQVAPDHE
jgi:hypothetical protein